MLSRICRLTAAAVLFGVLSVSVWSAEFSADLAMKSGDRQSRGKVFVKGTKMRCEFAQGDHRMVFLTESGKSSVTIIVPDKRIYWSQADATAADIFDDRRIVKQASKQLAGEETIGGYKCRKVVYTYRDKSKGVTTRWVSTKLKVPLKWEESGKNGKTVTEFRNIIERKLQASMFSPPPGFKKLTAKQVQAMMQKGAAKAASDKKRPKQ